MTALDRAFIKAFAEGHVHRPAPHFAVEASARPVDALQRAASAKLVDAAKPAGAVNLTRPPMATELKRDSAPLSTFAAHAAGHDSLDASVEVEELAWPESCVHLLARATDQWTTFAEHLLRQIGQEKKCIAIASCQRGAGRTTVALGIAKRMAERGLSCVVVDADFENPGLASSCGLSVESGWCEVLDGKRPLDDALVLARRDNVTIMPWRGQTPRMMQMSRNARMVSSFGVLRDRYDLVILDTMPLANVTLVADFASFAASIGLDAAYLIQDMRTTTREQLAKVCANLRRLGVPLGGILENFVAPIITAEVVREDRTPNSAGRKLAAHR